MTVKVDEFMRTLSTRMGTTSLLLHHLYDFQKSDERSRLLRKVLNDIDVLGFDMRDGKLNIRLTKRRAEEILQVLKNLENGYALLHKMAEDVIREEDERIKKNSNKSVDSSSSDL